MDSGTWSLTDTTYTALAKWNYNSSLFAYAEAATNTSSKLEPISYYRNTELDMISNHTNWHYLDNAGSLNNNGTAFGAYWVAAR